MNELNLYQLFKDIIAKSKVMRRFVTAPQYGVELNKNNAGEILKDFLDGITDSDKYPICIMFPPVDVPDFDTNWSKFKCRMFFLTPQHNDINGTQNRNPFNNLSEHTIQQTWKDMRQCAIDFRKFFNAVTEKDFSQGVRESSGFDVIDRYSDIGNDELAGVGLSFDVEIMTGCEMTDYNEKEIKNFKINTEDLHPHHEH